jgi:hypothetical protein
MVRTGCFKKFLKMVFRLPRMVLEVTLNGCDILLIEAVQFIVIVIAAASSNYDPSGAPPLLLLAALGAFVGGVGWCRPTATGDHFPITPNKDGPDCLLARGVPGGNIKQLLGSVRLIAPEFTH